MASDPWTLTSERSPESTASTSAQTSPYCEAVEPWQPTIDEYVELRHSQNGLSRQRMGDRAIAFDDAIRLAIDGLIQEGAIEVVDGRFQFDVDATIVWGKPRWPERGRPSPSPSPRWERPAAAG